MWGGSTALLMTLFNWYTPRQFGSGYEIVGRFVIFMGLGIYWGLYMWQKLSTLHSGKRTRTGNILRLVFFIILMLALIYALWSMSRH